MTATGPRIRLEGIGKRYGDTPALTEINLDIAGGSFVAFVGSSGSGKSTLLKTINRLIEPDSGTVRIGDADVRAGPAHLLRRRIGYVFQNVGLFPHLTVGENIAVGLKLEGRADPARVATLLALVDLPANLASRMPDALSGGQRQRVGVARALATEPGLMLMDEPFGALDPVTRDGLGSAYRALHNRLGLTTLMVTHDLTEALLIADRIVVVADGRIVADETPGTLARGGGGDVAQALFAVPRRQADRLLALEGGA